MTRSADELVTEFCTKWSTRTDVMRRKDGEPVPLPVTGVFEIENGQIKAWRDYFDMATITSAFS